MGRLFTGGAETRDSNNDGMEYDAGSSLAGATTVDTSIVRSGSASWKFDSTGTNSLAQMRVKTLTGTSITYFMRVYFYVSAFPASTVRVIGTTSNSPLSVRLTSGGTYQLWNDSLGSQIGSDSAAINAGEWHRVELKDQLDATGHCILGELVLDGTTVATSGTLNISLTQSFSIGWIGVPGASKQIYADDIALNDSTGASQNSYPGEGHVVLLLPTADSAVGTGWTLGTGTAIGGNSGSTAVKNTPPVGVADLAVGSDPKQIRNAASAANSNYDATMTTYAAAGIDTNDTVTLIDPIVATAAPVTTSSKQGTVGVASNPAITNVALGAGGTAGAFWSGLAGGTYPTGWKISHGTITYSPTVTVTTAPVMRITQVTASTRIAVVCFMGMYVEYVQVGGPAMLQTMQAVNRAASF